MPRAYRDALEAPVPERLRLTILPEATSSASLRIWKRSAWRFAPFAAGALVAAMLAVTFLPPRSIAQSDIAAGVVPRDTGLDRALDNLISGERQSLGTGTTLNLVATFSDARGSLCRDFQVF